MKPDRSNYEIWFIDWLDGKLGESEVGMLKEFLEKNPDLSEELEAFSLLNLRPPGMTFGGKEKLIKSAADYSEAQFESLCIARLENDLGPEQLAELNEVIGSDEDKRKKHDLIHKLRLKPPLWTFTRKSAVKKLTAGARIARFTAAGLSIAAAVCLLVALIMLLPSDFNRKRNITALSITRDTFLIYQPVSIESGKLIEYVFPAGRQKMTENIKGNRTPAETLPINRNEELMMSSPETVKPEALSLSVAVDQISIVSVSIPKEFALSASISQGSLAPYRPGIIPPLYDPYGRRSNVDRFVARFFHEKIMKDRRAGDRPVDAFEIAEAGVKGINKLFGWSMALEQGNNTGGEVRSYRFRSKLVNINTPVKKISDIL